MELLGERVLLREFRGDDLAALAAYHADARYLEHYGPEVGSPEHTAHLLDSFLAWAGEEPRRNFQLAIAARAGGALVGCCGLRTRGVPDGVAEFGVELAPERWGGGLALEASRLLLHFGFRTLLLAQVRAVAVAGNARVGALLRRLGFTTVGVRAGGERGRTLAEWSLARERWEPGPPSEGPDPRAGLIEP